MAAQFIYNLSATLKAGDKLLLGVDLIKPKELVLLMMTSRNYGSIQPESF
jgi:uncharacterized SAM-dependent methyltransferase